MDIFKENPNLDVAYGTTDGNYFPTRNAAENHAKSLKDKKVKKHVRPDAKNVNVLDADDPEVAAITTIQTGEKEDGTPDLKQVLAKTEDSGKTTVETVPVPSAAVNQISDNKQPTNVDSEVSDDVVKKITETPVIQALKNAVESTTTVKAPTAKTTAAKAPAAKTTKKD